MKKRIRNLLAGTACVGLLAVLSPAMLKESSSPRLNQDSFGSARHFYFARRQWLADARTVVAAFHYLYESRTASPAIPAEVATAPHPLPFGPIATNFFGIAHPATLQTNLQGA